MNSKFAWIVFFVLGVFLEIPSFASTLESIPAFQEINKAFPEGMRIKQNKQQVMEFCPDNTCDAFVGGKEIPIERMMDFAYIFVYYFSDFYVLTNWRTQESSTITIKKILNKPDYKGCKRQTQKQTARCVLHLLHKENHIKLYTVRYDEKVRHARRAKIP